MRTRSDVKEERAYSTYGLKSEGLREALDKALRGHLDDLRRLLARHGNLPSSCPNLELGAAFGVEIASQRRDVTALLTALAATPADGETADVFVPIAAAYGWVALLRASGDNQAAWNALHEFLADERAPVCMGVQDACVRLCGHPGQSDRLLTQALHWMDSDARGFQFGVLARIAEIFGKKTVLANLADKSGLREFLSGVLAAVSDAPRSASRLDSYRQLLTALPGCLAACVASAGSTSPLAHTTHTWLKNECTIAHHAPVRDVLSEAIMQLRASARGQATGALDGFRAALAGSAKPPRDPTRIRPGQGRGRRSRQIR
jgi:hypothetical protein